MPALMWQGKRRLPADLEEDEDDPENEMLVGILAQRARRREAARERESARVREEGQTGNQVHSTILSHVFSVDKL